MIDKMNTLKIIEGQSIEYKEKFKCIQSDCDGTGHIPEQVSEDEWTSHQCQFHAEYLIPIFNWHKQSIIQVLESEIERKRGMERKYGEETEEVCFDNGYNQALEEDIAHLSVLLDSLK